MNKTRLGTVAVVLVAGLAWWAWPHEPASDSGDPTGGYFPLAVGRQWVYEVETDLNEPDIEQTLTLSVDRQIELDGQPTWVRRSADGAEYYIQRDAQSIRRVASRTDLDEQAKQEPVPRVVLKLPLTNGASWDGGMTSPYLIRRSNEYPRTFRYTHKVPMTFQVMSMKEIIEVPYGSYSDCIRVEGRGYIKLFTDPVNGFTDVPLITTEWYCKGVGLVAFEREEKVPGGFMTGGKVSYKLVSMQ